ncbi:hypothetical protein E2C01_024608 [Portunus trituberculatus]|uniref:Uncharacterized protein n=1 Tax=Portunus trituberculatus TaxID=210409 RepID=A0A5B7EB20_PORTR|nr:hypothetical protein [Portunus trituberculatus]
MWRIFALVIPLSSRGEVPWDKGSPPHSLPEAPLDSARRSPPNAHRRRADRETIFVLDTKPSRAPPGWALPSVRLRGGGVPAACLGEAQVVATP